MKLKYIALTMAAIAMAVPGEVLAREGSRQFKVHNRLRLEYDDNIRETDSDKTDSFKIINELEFLVSFDLENTEIFVRYKPTFTWWENRSEDSTDLHHDFDFMLNHEFSPRLSLGVNNTFRYAEMPEVIERGSIVRQQNDFTYNALSGTLSYRVVPMGVLQLAGRYNLIRYKKTEVADTQDYDLYVGGLTYRHSLVPETSLMVDTRFETIEYDKVDRGSDTIMLGVGAEHMFNPRAVGNARVGYMYKDYNDNDLSSDSSPYFDVSLTMSPSPATRFTVGAGYSLLEADIFPFANQERLRTFLGVSHDVTAKITLGLSGSYSRARYSSEDAVRQQFEDADLERPDGDEDIVALSMRATYRINRSNWVEAMWQFSMLDSDLREDFERNRLSVGWATHF